MRTCSQLTYLVKKKKKIHFSFLFLLIMPLFETGTCFQSSDDSWQVFAVFIAHSHPTGIFWMICQRPAETHSLLSVIQLNVLVLSQRSLAVFLSDCRREHLKGRASLSPVTPFSHSTHGCLGFCAIAERLCWTQKVPE